VEIDYKNVINPKFSRCKSIKTCLEGPSHFPLLLSSTITLCAFPKIKEVKDIDTM
jgi:hypothetical protein